MPIAQSIWRSMVCIVLACLIVPESLADSARFTLIDARDGLTPEVIAAYTDALGGNATTPMIRRRVKVLASGQRGFAPPVVALPKQARFVDVDITLLAQTNSVRSAPVAINRLSLARRMPHRIRQTSQIIGY